MKEKERKRERETAVNMLFNEIQKIKIVLENVYSHLCP